MIKENHAEPGAAQRQQPVVKPAAADKYDLRALASAGMRYWLGSAWFRRAGVAVIRPVHLCASFGGKSGPANDCW
ncbi:MAG: hypothetical protein ACRDN0_10610 [Trebonia sp.]